MHWRHWKSEINDFYYFGPDIWILANAFGRTFTSTYCIHNPRTWSIWMGYFSYGTTWMSGIVSKIDGNDFQKYQKCHCLHWWSAHSFKDTQRAFRGIGRIFQSSEKIFNENQFEEMFFWISRSLLLGIQTNPKRNSSWKRQTQSNSESSSTKNGHWN